MTVLFTCANLIRRQRDCKLLLKHEVNRVSWHGCFDSVKIVLSVALLSQSFLLHRAPHDPAAVTVGYRFLVYGQFTLLIPFPLKIPICDSE